MNLNLPPAMRAEQVQNPKNVLFEAFRTASGRNARRLKKLNVFQCRLRVAILLKNFSPLRVLPAFRRLEDEIISFAIRMINDSV